MTTDFVPAASNVDYRSEFKWAGEGQAPVFPAGDGVGITPRYQVYVDYRRLAAVLGISDDHRITTIIDDPSSRHVMVQVLGGDSYIPEGCESPIRTMPKITVTLGDGHSQG